MPVKPPAPANRLHLVKLCVGADSIADLESWIERSLRERGEQVHTTRMVPKREADLLPDGSLYWVIKGQVLCRQRLMAVRPFTDPGGIRRCHLVLEPQVRFEGEPGERLVRRPECARRRAFPVSRLCAFEQMIRHRGRIGAVRLGEEPDRPVQPAPLCRR